MKLEIFESIADLSKVEEEMLFQSNLSYYSEQGIEIIRYDPVADRERFEEERIQSLLDKFSLPYFFVDGQFRLTGSYDLNKLKIRKDKPCTDGGCSGCSGRSCTNACPHGRCKKQQEG